MDEDIACVLHYTTVVASTLVVCSDNPQKKREWVKEYLDDRSNVPEINLRERLLQDPLAYR